METAAATAGGSAGDESLENSEYIEIMAKQFARTRVWTTHRPKERRC